MNSQYHLITLQNISSPNFLMTPLELKEYINFPVKRVYFITNTTGNSGQHAHRKEEDELFVMIQGSCKIIVDDGSGKEELSLAGPKSAIFVPHMVWHGFKDFSPDAILLALTSTNYDPTRADYCEDYTEFKQLTTPGVISDGVSPLQET
jgi:oxalate decarboxylase/phosphoglucose isomerase-like protein (cupin superfamily)